MPSKPIELPPEVAKAFVRDMKAFFAAGGTGVISRQMTSEGALPRRKDASSS